MLGAFSKYNTDSILFVNKSISILVNMSFQFGHSKILFAYHKIGLKLLIVKLLGFKISEIFVGERIYVSKSPSICLNHFFFQYTATVCQSSTD